jgi:hypothetical protein
MELPDAVLKIGAAGKWQMNYPAASSGVSQKALNAPRGGEYNPEVIQKDFFYRLVGYVRYW